MHRRKLFLSLAVLSAMIAIAALAQKKEKTVSPLPLQWAHQAQLEKPAVALLVEMGLKDTAPVKYQGQALVQGARVVHREGYRFRPEDKLQGTDSWAVSSHRPIRMPGRNPVLARLLGIETVGVVIHLQDVTKEASLTLTRSGEEQKETIPLQKVLAGTPHPFWKGAGQVRLITTTTRLSRGKTEDDFPAAAYGPDGTLWVAFIRYRLRDPGRRIEQAAFLKQPKNFQALYHPEFADQLVVTACRKGKWSEPVAITGANEDLVRCGIAGSGAGTAWVAYSAQRKGNFDIYARKIDLAARNMVGPEQRITRASTPDLAPVLTALPEGGLALACQSWKEAGKASIQTFTCREGKWSAGANWGSENCWHPAIALNPQGKVVVAHDEYLAGDYDLRVTELGADGSKVASVTNTASSSRFEARPSMCYDAAGRLWIAYEEGPARWGKDYGALDAGAGHPLYDERSVRVVCLAEGTLNKPVAELPIARYEAPRIPFDRVKTNRFERGTRYAYPQIGIDGKGRVWVVYREKFGSRYSSHPGSYWLSFARCLLGERWSAPIEIHHSDGLLDHRPVLLPHPAGGLLIVHNSDGRYTTPNDVQNRISTSYVDLPGEPIAPRLVPHHAGTKDPGTTRAYAQERKAIQRIRNYRIEAGGKTYQLLRGEFHRHTEVSWDGGADGSLEDMFRYAIDAAGMDWLGNADHDNGAGREYPWWLTQKLTDAYLVPGHFTPPFSYERSVSYPHGHRNCMFAQRGVMTLPRLAEPDRNKRVAGINADDTKMLYRYLHELKGICAVHTSATGMGTDWRDNDPVVEPLVEIYQGDRMSYEIQGAPRAGYDPSTGKEPANIGGWRPLGFLDNALRGKGYRLSFEASSDHWSTHISYSIAVAEKHDRAGIVAALGKRHCYGATDNIIVDVRCGEHVMGDAFAVKESPTFDIHVMGTAPLARVDVLKDSKVVHSFTSDGPEFKGTWKDPASAGSHYYYVRVVQKDGELAWGSPLWTESTGE
jgi:hypothetical protein